MRPSTKIRSLGLAVDGDLNVFAGGSTSGSLFGPNVGESDLFLLRLTPVPEPTVAALLLLGLALLTPSVFHCRRA